MQGPMYIKLETIFLSYQSIRIPGVVENRLKKFYCIIQLLKKTAVKSQCFPVFWNRNW